MPRSVPAPPAGPFPAVVKCHEPERAPDAARGAVAYEANRVSRHRRSLQPVVAEGAVLGWLLMKPANPVEPAKTDEVPLKLTDANFVKASYAHVDFAPIYPGWSAADIDLVQRESFSVPFVYEPFVQFRPMAVKGQFVEVTDAGYRVGLGPQPWPPNPDDFVVFVFGGSTTFSYGLPNDKTVVAWLEREWRARRTGVPLQVYNFGAGYYFSSQERILFESLLLRGFVPDAAVFIDGVNDFAFADGNPQLTQVLSRAVTPNLRYPKRVLTRSPEESAQQVEAVLERYRRNLQLIGAIAQKEGVKVLFVGQPSPFVEYPRNDTTYPFRQPFFGHDLAAGGGYSRFQDLADHGTFGANFVWCGDVFEQAQSSMYADGIHYSLAGAEVLARAIVDRADARGLLP